MNPTVTTTDEPDEMMTSLRRELEAMAALLDALEPIEAMEGRCRVLAMAAMHFGLYELARSALDAAAVWREREAVK
jgi:hypothetical protein